MEPLCLIPGQPVNACARKLYAEKVLGHVDLSADWAGWRLRGRWLISPDGDRVNPQRLRGMLFREANERRHKAGLKSGQQGAAVIALGIVKTTRQQLPDSEP
ncbi:DUF3653 domain-containing protein [Arenimonas caeni]|uniref:Uncharacterized protein n=1 Tax=Arenimonas caeni TaxID=2058085 RepID=A0A2P6MB05_9GAMM|nr:DUF3653 domain-containing protein [Arenimonas caeni]PRH83168.1 hypothetical protein C6N40_03110 [Arenimonas caeni]